MTTIQAQPGKAPAQPVFALGGAWLGVGAGSSPMSLQEAPNAFIGRLACRYGQRKAYGSEVLR